MGKIVPYLLVGLIVAAFVWQQNTITSLSEDLGVSSQQIKQLSESQKKMEKSISDFNAKRTEYDSKIKALDEKGRTKNNKLTDMKNRESVLAAKPGLTEKQINDSFKKAANMLSCSTGATERCE